MDEFGRSTCRPRNGRPWQPLRRPRRLRATYTRPAGVIDMLAALDLATGRMHVIADPVGRLVWASPGPCPTLGAAREHGVLHALHEATGW